MVVFGVRRKKNQKKHCGLKNSSYLCSVKTYHVTYNNVPNTCGGLSLTKDNKHSHNKKYSHNNKFSHTHRHTTYKDTPNPTEESVLSFSIPVAISLLKNASYKQAKALAFVALVRAHEHVTNKRQSYTVNQLHVLTGCHSKTIEQRLITLNAMGLLSYDENGKILIRTIRSKHKGMNLVTTISLCKKALKKAEQEILSVRIINKLNQITYFRNVLTRYHEIKNAQKAKRGDLKELKTLKRWLRGHCNMNYEKEEFKERGWSYIKIAEYLGTSIRKAFDTINYAINNNFITKKVKVFCMVYCDSAQLYYMPNTFNYNKRIYRVFSNRYTVKTDMVI